MSLDFFSSSSSFSYPSILWGHPGPLCVPLPRCRNGCLPSLPALELFPLAGANRGDPLYFRGLYRLADKLTEPLSGCRMASLGSPFGWQIPPLKVKEGFLSVYSCNARPIPCRIARNLCPLPGTLYGGSVEEQKG